MSPQAQMEVEWACARLVQEFAFCMDRRRYEALAALFTPDGVFDRVGQVLRGRAAIQEALAARSVDLRTRHLCASPRFSDVESTTARALVYCVNFVGRGDIEGVPSIHGMAQGAVLEFEDRYERTPEGWRIAERLARPVVMPEETPSH